jgi:hypothetical protein
MIASSRRFHVVSGLLSALLIGVLIHFFLAPVAAVANGKPDANGALFWPSGMDGWKVAEGPTLYDPQTAYTYMDGAAELFLAYNMKRLTVVRYEKTGRPAITVEIYRMGSPSDAYGLFWFESDDPGAGIGQGSEFGGGLLRFWKGPWFVSIYGEDQGADVETTTLGLGKYIAAAITEEGKPPEILNYLPRGEGPYTKNQSWFFHSHILLNQRFFVAHKNVLNLTNDVDVALGRYGIGKDRIHVLLMRYPSQGRAQEALAGFRGAIGKGGGEWSSTKTENNRWTAVERYGGYLVILFDAPDEALARRWAKSAIRNVE